MFNPLDIQMSSATTSLKVWLEGIGTLSVPATLAGSSTIVNATVPHGYPTDQLLWQATTPNSGTGTDVGQLLPWESNDGRFSYAAELDNTNLYIYVLVDDTVGSGTPAFVFNFSYRILVP